MSGIIYKVGVTSGRAFVRTYTNALTEDLLHEGNLTALLLEELNDEDAKEMDATLQEFSTTVAEVVNQMPAGAESEWDTAMQPIMDIFDGTEYTDLYDETLDGKARAKAASDLTKRFKMLLVSSQL